MSQILIETLCLVSNTFFQLLNVSELETHKYTYGVMCTWLETDL